MTAVAAAASAAGRVIMIWYAGGPATTWPEGVLCWNEETGELVAGLLGGQASYSWTDWAGALGWSGFGNLAGGIGLVTSLRLLQTPHRVAEERDEQSLAAPFPGVFGLEGPQRG